MNELGNGPWDKNYKPSGTSKEEQLCAACCPYYGKIPDQCGYTERKMQWDCPYFDFIERGYEQAEKDILAIIKSRISEILGDAQPAPILRAELQELINKIDNDAQ